MPELKHHFRAGKMNKDLDERLVPNGEYRDAQNIEISTSEGDDVGTVQNVLGTTLIKGKTYNAQTNSITSDWPSVDFGLTNPVCIGTKLNNENDKIYWFITSTTADCIAEYDDRKGIISPVLVDTNNILNFNRNQYITGINVLEEQLMWTDNTSEPKKIDIGVFKSGCSGNFTTHTKYTGSKILSTANLSSLNDFVEENITVVRKSPITAPSLTMTTSTRGGNGTGTSPVVVSNSTASTFTDSDGNAIAPGVVQVLQFTPQPNFLVGDIITLTAEYEEQASRSVYEIKVRVTNVANSGSQCTVVVQSIPIEIPYVNLVWEALLSEEGVLFEKKFVRFSYRWKYKNGEYSVFAPFSEIAFRPSSFEYLSTNGHNVGMINNLRELTVNIPAGSTPIDVDEVDILFKESNNQLVYVVDTLKKDSNGNIDYSYNIESEIIGKVVESNQMLRPYDNVPRRALSQEVTANRLIYGNYLENFNIGPQNTPELSIAVQQSPITQVREPELSIKSLRTYQIGVVYSDEYNRQSPVFTSALAGKQLGKSYAETVNTLTAQLSNTPPPWASHFRYYVKETSNEYYNLSMDRYYTAEDGNVWLSFPSSERNKVTEESYLILKKQHDADTFVKEKARYKILDISNEAPDFIKLIKKALAGVTAKVKTGDQIPQVGSTTFKFLGPDPLSQPSFADGFTSEGFIQFSTGSQKSEKYGIVSGGFTGEEASGSSPKHIYSVTIDEPIKDGESVIMNSINASNNPTFDIVLYQETFKRKPEFYGRFFVKINRDGQFDTNIIQTYPDVEAEYGIVNSRDVLNNIRNDGPGDGRQDAAWKDTRNKHNKVHTSAHPRVGSNEMSVYWAGAPGNKTKSFQLHKSINSWLKALNTAGTLIRFVRNGALSEVYVITASQIKTKYRRNGRKRLQSSKRRQYKITFEHALNGTPFEDGDISGLSGRKPDNIQIVEKVISGDNEVLTSDNPAIWETEPKEAIDLDLYYETGNVLPINQHGQIHSLPFKNCYSFGNGVESNRLRDDFNAVTIDKGVRVSTVLAEQYKEERKPNSLIFSGIFNSTSGVNRLNQFIQGEAITKDMNPHYGSIQKLHARNTDLIVFCEDKVLKVLANKDALFEAGGSAQLTATNRVLGQAIPFVGEYGISNNPESFASYAFRVYFADRNRGAILRLSRDGLTPISDNGMRDFFKDILPGSTLVLGSYDDSKGLYNLTLKNQATGLTKAVRSTPITKTVSFDEKVNGFPSFKSFIPEGALSLNNRYYSIKNGALWVHTNTKRNRFYDTSSGQDDATKYYDSSVTLLINDAAETIKGYKTLNYSGSRSKVYTNDYDASNNYANPSSTVTPGWHCESIDTDTQQGFVKEFKKKEGRYYNHIKGDATTLSNLDSQEFSVQGIGQLTNLSGDVNPLEKNLTIGLVNATGQTTLDNVTVTGTSVFPIPATTSISATLPNATLVITPNKGFALAEDAIETSSGVGGSSLISSMNFTGVGDDGDGGVNSIDARFGFASSSMPNVDTTANVVVSGIGAEPIKFRLHDLSLTHNTDSGITVTTTYSGSGNGTANPDLTQTGYPGNYNTQYTVATKTFDLASNKDFKVEPTFEILSQNITRDSEDEYEITHQDYDAANTAVTVGVGGVTLSTVSKRIYTIKYKFDAQDQTGDKIVFDAQSTDALFDPSNLVTGYRVDGGSATVSRFAGTKNLYIYGKPAATFRLKNDLQITATAGSGSTINILSGYEKAVISFGASTIALARASSPVHAVDLNTTIRGYFTNETISNQASDGGQTWPTSANASNPEVDNGVSYKFFKIKYYNTSNELKEVVVEFSTTSGQEGRILQYSSQQAATGDLFDFDNSIRPGMLVSSRTVSVPSDTTVDSYVNGVITVSNPTNTALPSWSNGDTFNFEQYWEDGGFVSNSSAAVTIPASGIYTVELPFSEVVTSTQYNLLLTATGDSSLATDLTGNVYESNGDVANPFTIAQLADVRLSIGTSGKGVTMNTSEITGWDLTATHPDHTYTEDTVDIPIYDRMNSTRDFMANGYPVETSTYYRIPLIFSCELPGVVTQLRTPDITDFSNYNANGFDWDFEVIAERVTGTNTYQLLAYAMVEKYGTISTNMDLLVNNFLSVANLGNPGGLTTEIPILSTTLPNYNLGIQTTFSYTDADGNSVTGANRVKVGTPANTILTWYVKIFGDFSGQTINSVFKDFEAVNAQSGSGNVLFDMTYGTDGVTSSGTKFDGGTFTSSGHVYETSAQVKLANTVTSSMVGNIIQFDFTTSGGGSGSGSGGTGFGGGGYINYE